MFVVVVSLLSIAPQIGHANNRQLVDRQIVDPFFMIQYDPDRVHFETMPDSLRKRCPEVGKRYQKAWVYSQMTARRKQYFILYGFIKIRQANNSEKAAVELEEDDGAIVEVSGKGCKMDQWQFFLRNEINPARDATPISVPDVVRREIAAQVLQSYTKAFGSKSAFLQKIRPDAREGLPPVLKEELEQFEKLSNREKSRKY